MGEREVPASCVLGQAAIGGKALAGPECQLEAGLQGEERDRSVLELGTDDALRIEAEAIPIEGDRAFEVVDAEGDESNAWLYGT